MIQPTSFQEIASTFLRLDDWEDRYRYIIELGQALPALTEGEKTDANRILGCASQVWLVPSAEQREGQISITFRGGSDAMIVQGLVGVLLAIYSGRSPSEIARIDALTLFDKLGLREHLSTQRSNGLAAMVKHMRTVGTEHLKHIQVGD